MTKIQDEMAEVQETVATVEDRLKALEAKVELLLHGVGHMLPDELPKRKRQKKVEPSDG